MSKKTPSSESPAAASALRASRAKAGPKADPNTGMSVKPDAGLGPTATSALAALATARLNPPPSALPTAPPEPLRLGSLAGLDATTVGHLLSTAADLTLVLDSAGVIVDLAFGNASLAQELGTGWIGQKWSATVGEESLPKVAALMADPLLGAMRWRHINHMLPGGGTISIGYATHPVAAQDGAPYRLFAFGRDQRSITALQQRLVEAQSAGERDCVRFRQAELRYRQLFQQAGEAVLVVDAGSSKVLEANPAAAAMMGLPADKLVGQVFPMGLSPRSTKAVASLMAKVRRTGAADPVSAELGGALTADPVAGDAPMRGAIGHGGHGGHGGLAGRSGQSSQSVHPGPAVRTAVRLSAALFHQDQSPLLLVRLTRVGGAGRHEAAAGESDMLLQLAQGLPDGLVVTDLDGRVLAANAEFVSLCQMAGVDPMRGQSLDRWLGRTGVDLGVLVSNLRQRSAVKLFATTLRGEYGLSTDVEISAVMVAQADPPLLGFTVRDVGRRLAQEPQAQQILPRSVNQLTELVGRVPMKDIVGETTDLIEKRCIEVALELTRDNRASAAEILGLSRQSLYVKLRRFGLGDLGPGIDK